MTDDKDLNEFISIKGFEDYMINKDGVVINSSTNDIIKPGKSNNVGLYRIKPKGHSRQRKFINVGKLVYKYFGDEVDNIDTLLNYRIKHLDGNHQNNNIDNLQLVRKKHGTVGQTTKERVTYKNGHMVTEIIDKFYRDFLD